MNLSSFQSWHRKVSHFCRLFAGRNFSGRQPDLLLHRASVQDRGNERRPPDLPRHPDPQAVLPQALRVGRRLHAHVLRQQVTIETSNNRLLALCRKYSAFLKKIWAFPSLLLD